jgi:SAM-dependent methyltransferase
MERKTNSGGTPGAGADADRVRQVVREGYARIVDAANPANPAETSGASAGGCCGTGPAAERRSNAPASACCGSKDVTQFARGLGYDESDLSALPEGANLGLSCGNPTALAALGPGEIVVDLGCGAGFDVLIASRKVGAAGRVIGVDMTPEMLQRARENARKVGATNVEFRLGEIEHLPLADASADVVISNCVINLSPDKPAVFREIARVLRPGGRVAVSDMALLRPLPEEVQRDVAAYVGCVSGAVLLAEYVAQMRRAGFTDVVVETENGIDPMEDVQDPLYRTIQEKLPAGTRPADYVASVRVEARKPSA